MRIVKRKRLIAAIAIAAVLMPLQASAQSSALDWIIGNIPARGWFDGTVTQVVGGDRLVVGTHRVRLWGIQGGGPAARAYLAKLVAGRSVSCRPLATERHGVTIAECINRSTRQDLASALVWTGHALDCPRMSGGRYARFEGRWSEALLPRSRACGG